MINKIYRGIKRFLFGSTSYFTTRKGSTSLLGASWISIFTEITENPIKLVSVEFLTEKTVPVEYRICVDGQKIFPFSDCSHVESGISRNFMLPINIASNSYLQIEVRGSINDKSVIILSELACIEVK